MPSTRTRRSTVTPSRKKSCLPCAKAKVRCDLERPRCARCLASERTCTYTSQAASSSASPLKLPLLSSPVIRAPAPETVFTTAEFAVAPPIAAPFAITPLSLPRQPLLPSNNNDNHVNDCLDFTLLDLVPLSDADSIRDRWLRPFLASIADDQDNQQQQQDVPKSFHPYTLQYMNCVLRTYPRLISESDNELLPPFIHPVQIVGKHGGDALANCCSLARLWQQRAAGSDAIVADTVRREMDRLSQTRNTRDVDHLAVFQAYLIYTIMAYLLPIPNINSSSGLVNDTTMFTLQEMAFRAAQGGLASQAELAGTRPSWESWIVASAKRRTMITFYLLSSVYNADNNVPKFLAHELRDILAPSTKYLWQATTRDAWKRQYDRHLARWPDGQLTISELWRSPATGSEACRDRIDRWAQDADEFGMMLLAVCVHLHGY